jgi:hypothetical protein
MQAETTAEPPVHWREKARAEARSLAEIAFGNFSGVKLLSARVYGRQNAWVLPATHVSQQKAPLPAAVA